MSQSSHHPRAITSREQYSAGDRIASHWHDDDQLVYVSSGLMAVHTDTGAWIAAPGRAVFIPAQTRHEHRVFGRSLLHLVGFDVDSTSLPDEAPSVVTVDALLHEVLIAGTDAALTRAERVHLRRVLLDRLCRSTAVALQVRTARDPRLAEVCDLVTGDLSRPRTLSWLARRANVGERTLARLFRDEFGQTYPQWRTTARLYQAMIDLAEDRSVTDTAQRCGFATTSAFIDTFRRSMGRTPGQHRRENELDGRAGHPSTEDASVRQTAHL